MRGQVTTPGKINHSWEGYMYWVYFRGTRNGEHIAANSLQDAKWIFAVKNNLTSITYIAASKINHLQEVTP